MMPTRRRTSIDEADQPVIFVPVEAEDLARRRRRKAYRPVDNRHSF